MMCVCLIFASIHVIDFWDRLSHWGRVTHICISKLTIMGSDIGLSPGRCQAIIWTIVRILLIRTLGTNFSEMLIQIHTFSFKKIHLKMLSGKWRPFCLSLNVLIKTTNETHSCRTTQLPYLPCMLKWSLSGYCMLAFIMPQGASMGWLKKTLDVKHFQLNWYLSYKVHSNFKLSWIFCRFWLCTSTDSLDIYEIYYEWYLSYVLFWSVSYPWEAGLCVSIITV